MSSGESSSQALGPRQVLIRVYFAPVTNFDKACICQCKSLEKVESKEKHEACKMGSEGSGIIEEVGSDLLQKNLKGRKVAFCNGSWS